MRRNNRSAVVAVGMVVAIALLASACQWSFARYDSGNTGYNPTESEITAANASGLHEEWASTSLGGGVFWTPIVLGTRVFVAGQTGTPLSAFDSTGVEGCSGAPTTCEPLFTTTGFSGQPFVANGILFAQGVGGMRAFDPAGVTNCAGSPKVCQPMWTSSASVTQAVVVGDVLFGLTGSNAVVAYDVNGVINCSGTPRVCTPLRTYAPSCPSWAWSCLPSLTLSAAGDELVVAGHATDGFQYRVGLLTAYDLSGDRSCSGTPTVCASLWQSIPGASANPPALSQDVVYRAGTARYLDPDIGVAPEHTLVALHQQDGATIWSATLPSAPIGIAVGEGSVFVTLTDRLLTFPQACTTNCPPSRTAPLAGNALAPPSLANGVVVVGTSAGMQAFSANGSVGCGGTPVSCTPLVTLAPGVQFGGTAIAFGNVWSVGSDGKLRAFGLG